MAEPKAVDKSGEKVRAMFASIAGSYDFLNHFLSLNIDTWWRRYCIRRVPPKPALPILDVCTGTGDLAIGYARAAGPETPVTGADFCPPMLVRAEAKAKKLGYEIQFVEADAQQLPFPDNQFQIVSCAFGLRNISNTRRGLAEMIRVARPAGKIAILEFSRPRLTGLSSIYLFYFKYVLPMVGQMVSWNRHDAYRYLPASVLEFPDGPELCAILTEMGLVDVRHYPLTLGIATLYIGSKPGSELG